MDGIRDELRALTSDTERGNSLHTRFRYRPDLYGICDGRENENVGAFKKVLRTGGHESTRSPEVDSTIFHNI